MAETSTSNKTFKPVIASAGLRFIRPSELAANGVTGEILEGVYLSSQPNQMDDAKLDYKFETASGETVILNGAGNLGRQMEAVTVGTLVRINYNGKQLIQSGPRKGKEAHNFLVLVESEA